MDINFTMESLNEFLFLKNKKHDSGYELKPILSDMDFSESIMSGDFEINKLTSKSEKEQFFQFWNNLDSERSKEMIQKMAEVENWVDNSELDAVTSLQGDNDNHRFIKRNENYRDYLRFGHYCYGKAILQQATLE